MSTLRALRETGEDIIHLQEQGLQRLPDCQILAKAERESRIILTFDLDFRELLALGGQALPSVVIFRTRNQTPAVVTARLRRVVSEYEVALEKGAIVLVEDRSYRLRRLPIFESPAE